MERSLKELLIILRDNTRVTYSWFGLKQKIKSGFCLEAYFLFDENIINFKEYQKILFFFFTKRPYSIYPGYGWKPKLWRPRKRWLNKYIKNL